jgi:thiol-disulfide isomerase/thioredoxin
MTKKVALAILAALMAGLFALLTFAADQPLSAADITLLLLAGSPAQKIVTLVEQRGISFKMNPDLAKKFHDAGASDDLIEALTKAGPKAIEASSGPAAAAITSATPSGPAAAATAPAAPSGSAAAATASAAPSGPAAPATAPAASQQTQPAYTPIPTSEPSDVDRKIAETLSSLESKPADNDRPYAARFRLVALSGERIDLADYKGKVVLLNFWASWCPHCRKLIPALIRFQRQYYGEGLRIVGIAVRDQKQAVKSFCQHGNINYPVAMANADIRQLYGGISGLPTTVFIGRDGRIYRRLVGEPRDLDWFEGSVTRLLARPAGGTEGSQRIAAKPAPTTTTATAPPLTAGSASSPAPTAASQISTATLGASASAPASSQQAPAANTSASNSKPADVDGKVAETLNSLMDKSQTSETPAKAAPANDLKDPNPQEVQRIIREFAAKEKVFKEARNNYTYHQINKVQELGPDNEVEGAYVQEWDILFDDAGNRIERVTYAPADTLKRVQMTAEDLTSMRNTQPFVLTTDELPEYDIKYLGHVKVDQITAYVFSIRPKEIVKGHQYFQGVVWVDDQDLQIVKSEGKPVPELHTKKGENLFPRFTTWREQIDGKFWFPTYTLADDTLYFSSGPVHLKEILRYTDYKQFKSKVRIISATPTDQPNAPAVPVTPKQ